MAHRPGLLPERPARAVARREPLDGSRRAPTIAACPTRP